MSIPCQAAGIPKPKITWYKNGQIFTKNGDLRIPEIEFADRGTYTCSAANLMGQAKTTLEIKVHGRT